MGSMGALVPGRLCNTPLVTQGQLRDARVLVALLEGLSGDVVMVNSMLGHSLRLHSAVQNAELIAAIVGAV